MKKTVGCFTEEKLKELSNQENTVVMQPTHDVVFEAWPASKVSVAVDTIINFVNTSELSQEEVVEECKNKFTEFANKYQVMFNKITNREFLKDHENVRVLKKLILLKAAVDNNATTNEFAQAQASDIALKSLATRVKNKNS